MEPVSAMKNRSLASSDLRKLSDLGHSCSDRLKEYVYQVILILKSTFICTLLVLDHSGGVRVEPEEVKSALYIINLILAEFREATFSKSFRVRLRFNSFLDYRRIVAEKNRMCPNANVPKAPSQNAALPKDYIKCHLFPFGAQSWNLNLSLYIYDLFFWENYHWRNLSAASLFATELSTGWAQSQLSVMPTSPNCKFR